MAVFDIVELSGPGTAAFAFDVANCGICIARGVVVVGAGAKRPYRYLALGKGIQEGLSRVWPAMGKAAAIKSGRRWASSQVPPPPIEAPVT